LIDIITYTIIILAGIILSLLIAYPLRFLRKPFKNITISVIVLGITNIIGFPFHLQIGINFVTVAMVSLLGIPGYTTLILLTVLL